MFRTTTYSYSRQCDASNSKFDKLVASDDLDIHFSDVLPPPPPETVLAEYSATAIGKRRRNKHSEHRHEPHDHDEEDDGYSTREQFSWRDYDPNVDDDVMREKKLLIHKPMNQGLCGSCWSICIATTMSDCFVVSGATDWSPNISPTYMMVALPQEATVHRKCKGGNPARVALELEKLRIADTSCVDYSWCAEDEICTAEDAAKHFDAARLGDLLNSKIPKPLGCYFGGVDRFMYRIDRGSNAYSIDDAASGEEFVRRVKCHLIDFGPTIAGFTVLRNFSSGRFTRIGGGVYFDRADYNALSDGDGEENLIFNDAVSTRVSGLHAVSVVGWGVAKNVRYDNDKRGDVPYWHCRNSWGDSWGADGGFFKIAMYPYNLRSQLDKKLLTGTGGMVLIRCCVSPEKRIVNQTVDARYAAKTLRPERYYKRDADEIADSKNLDDGDVDVDDEEKKKKKRENRRKRVEELYAKKWRKDLIGWILVAVGGGLFVAGFAYVVYVVVFKRRGV